MLYSYMTKNDFKSNLSFENQLVTGFKSIQYANVFFYQVCENISYNFDKSKDFM